MDEFWLQHTRDEEKYRADCDLLFGRYVNRNLALSTERATLRRTEIYQDFDVWSLDVASDALFSPDIDSTDNSNFADTSDPGCSDSNGDAGSCDAGSDSSSRSD